MSTEKCLEKGSSAPGPVPDGKIRIYSMRFCPYAHRTRLVLNAKGIENEIVNINLKNKPEWYLEKNPTGAVPTLETPAGELICESTITSEYLDDAYGENKLLPSSPFAKAQQKMMLENFSKIITFLYTIPMVRKKGEDVSGMQAELEEKFAKLDQDLKKKKTMFFGGNSITMIDYMMWPWFERLEVFGQEHLISSTPELKKWVDAMSEDPAVKATMHSKDKHKAFFKGYVEGTPNYDLGL